jgi:hypothetical protein
MRRATSNATPAAAGRQISPNGIVETAPPLDAEVLGHGDLHGLDPVAIPQRLEHRVVEPQEQDVHRRFLAQKVVDAEDLTFVQDPAQLFVQRLGRGQIVAEGFFHHDPSAGGEVGMGKSSYHQAEQRGRDLEVKDGTVPPLDRFGDSVIGLWIPKVAGDHRKTLCEAAEYLFV